jgi:hypothetical protein
VEAIDPLSSLLVSILEPVLLLRPPNQDKGNNVEAQKKGERVVWNNALACALSLAYLIERQNSLSRGDLGAAESCGVGIGMQGKWDVRNKAAFHASFSPALPFIADRTPARCSI